MTQTGSNSSFSEIAKHLRSAQRIGVACHVRPDGDALGSMLGLVLSLRELGKEVHAFSHDGVPWILDFLPGVQTIIRPVGESFPLDLAIAVDTATKERLGEHSVAALAAAPLLINIDHHPTNPRYGHLNHIDGSVPAVGQLIYELLAGEGFPITDGVRQNLYTAISTDTGSFQYPSTTARTYQIAGEMVAAGLDVGSLNSLIYDRKPLRCVELLGTMIHEMEFCSDGRIASWRYTQATKARLHIQPGDTEGLIDLMRGIDSVIAAVIFEELKNGQIRVSARSKSNAVNVANVCGQFGGGGHHLAAGATLPGPIQDAARQYLQALQHEVQRAN
jgi:bifunctional oligoribonuclease and PAP phosphatase NrnA